MCSQEETPPFEWKADSYLSSLPTGCPWEGTSLLDSVALLSPYLLIFRVIWLEIFFYVQALPTVYSFSHFFPDYNKLVTRNAKRLKFRKSVIQLLEITTVKSLVYIHLEQGFLISDLLVFVASKFFGKLPCGLWND